MILILLVKHKYFVYVHVLRVMIRVINRGESSNRLVGRILFTLWNTLIFAAFVVFQLGIVQQNFQACGIKGTLRRQSVNRAPRQEDECALRGFCPTTEVNRLPG